MVTSAQLLPEDVNENTPTHDPDHETIARLLNAGSRVVTAAVAAGGVYQPDVGVAATHVVTLPANGNVTLEAPASTNGRVPFPPGLELRVLLVAPAGSTAAVAWDAAYGLTEAPGITAGEGLLVRFVNTSTDPSAGDWVPADPLGIAVGDVAPANAPLDALWVDTSAASADPSETAASLASRIHVVGHSLSAGGGSSTMDRAWHNLLGGMLRAEVVNYGRGGGVLVWGESGTAPYGQTGDGGFGRAVSSPPPAKVRDYKGAWAAGATYKAGDVAWTGASLDALSWWRSQVDANTGHDPTADAGANWLPLAGEQTRQWSPSGRLPVIMYGLNDLGWDGNLTAFLAALRYVLSFFQAAEVTVRADDPRCSYSAGFGAASAAGSAGTSYASSAGGHLKGVPAGAADYEDIVIPADFAGGHVTLGYVGTQPTATVGRLSVFVDGSANAAVVYDLKDTMTHLANKAGCFAVRVPLAPGPHHLRVQVTTPWDQGAIYTDYLAIEANPVPPAVVAGGLFYPLKAYAAVYGAGTTASDANVDAWCSAIAGMLAAEFPGAYYWDLPAVIGKNRDPSRFYSDKLHPNDVTHADLAVDLRRLLEEQVAPAVTAETAMRLSRAPRVGHTVRQDFGTDFGGGSWLAPLNAWGTFVYGTTAPGNPTRTVEVGVRAEAGDVIELSLVGSWGNTANALGYIDIATATWPNGPSGAASLVNYVSSGGPAQAGNGIPGAGLNAGQFGPLLTGTVSYKVRPEDLVGGEVTFQVIAKSLTAQKAILLSTNNPLIMTARNTGQWQPFQGERQAT